MTASPLLVYAAPAEAGPHADHARTLALGVGKVAATLRLSQRLSSGLPSGVVVFGVAGAHRGGPAVGEGCVVTTDWLADEGVWAPDGFIGIDALGLGERGPFAADAALTDWVEQRLGTTLPRVAGATVSLCSGTDAGVQRALAACPGAAVETMEGAAIAAVCQAHGVAWAQLRVVSNRTGDRDRGGWDLPAALATLHPMVGRLLAP